MRDLGRAVENLSTKCVTDRPGLKNKLTALGRAAWHVEGQKSKVAGGLPGGDGKDAGK
jgi:hypothetical protein